MTKQQKQLKNFLESLLVNYGNTKNILNKKKQQHVFNQKAEYSPGFYLVQNHLQRASKRNINNDRAVPIETTTLNEYNLKTGSNLENVKIMYGAYSDELTRAYHATALTIGATIYFSTKAYKPETEEGRKTLAHELTHVQQNKDDIFINHKTKDELESDAEQAEQIANYNPDPLIIKRIDGVEYRYRKSVWKKIAANVFRGVEEFVEREEGRMSNADYLKLLLNYQDWLEEYRREWEV